MKSNRVASLSIALGLLVTSGAAAAVSAEEELARKSGCFKCHAVEKEKDGPPYKEIAEKYRDKADAEETLFKHMTTSPMVEVNGKEKEHKQLKTEDEAEIRAVIKWILSF